MAAWTSDELNKIGKQRTGDRASAARRHAANPGDDLGRPPRRRPLRPLLQGERRLLEDQRCVSLRTAYGLASAGADTPADGH